MNPKEHLRHTRKLLKSRKTPKAERWPLLLEERDLVSKMTAPKAERATKRNMTGRESKRWESWKKKHPWLFFIGPLVGVAISDTFENREEKETAPIGGDFFQS